MAGQEPEKWQLPAGLSTDQWSVAWADEILPIAKEAHDRLEFRAIHLDTEKHLARGLAAEKSNASPRYRDWAGKIVHDELHKAGWRLAAIVEEAMKSAGQPDDR